MEKTKLIKNIGTFAGYLLCLAAFVYVLVNPIYAEYQMLILMIGVVFPVFSLSWTIHRAGIERMLNMVLLLLGVILCLGYIISSALFALRGTIGFETFDFICAAFLGAYSLGLLIYALLIDLGKIGRKEEAA